MNLIIHYIIPLPIQEVLKLIETANSSQQWRTLTSTLVDPNEDNCLV